MAPAVNGVDDSKKIRTNLFKPSHSRRGWQGLCLWKNVLQNGFALTCLDRMLMTMNDSLTILIKIVIMMEIAISSDERNDSGRASICFPHPTGQLPAGVLYQ